MFAADYWAEQFPAKDLALPALLVGELATALAKRRAGGEQA